MSKSTDDASWHRLRSVDAVVPADAVVVVAFLVLADGILLLPLDGSVALRALVGLPLLFLVPGYALVAGLFPGHAGDGSAGDGRRVFTDGTGLRDRGIDFRERLALSFGASVVLLPVLAIALSLMGLPYSLDVLSPAVSALALGGMAVGVVRRNRLPASRRFRLPYRRWASTVNEGVFGRQSALDSALNVVLAVVVLAALAGVGYAVVTPNNAESFTSVTLLTENGDGELTASGYPDALGQSGSELVVRLENHEGTSTSYTVVGQLQRVERGDGTTTVLDRETVMESSASLDAGESWSEPHTVEPALLGQDLRLVYYVYEGEAPANPTTESAYRHVYVTVDALPQAAG